jgi:hypothetical protein
MIRRKKQHGAVRSYALFDIGASSIGVGLGICSAAGAEVLWYARTDFAFLREQEYVRYEKSMYATLLELGMRMMSEGMSAASRNSQFTVRGLQVTCVLGPPWFLGTVTEETVRQDTAVAVTQAMIDSVHAKMVAAFLETPERASWSEVMGSPELLEQYDLGVWLDGYPVSVYKDQVVREVHVRTYLAVVAQSVNEHVRDILHRVMPNHTVSLTTATRLFVQGVRTHEVCATKRSVVLLDVGGQITNSILIRHGICVGTKTIPYGENDLLRAIAPQAANAKEAHGAYTVYEKQHSMINPQTTHSAEFEEAGTQWQSAVVESLIALSEGVLIPRTVFLSAADFYAPYARFFSKPVRLPGIRTEQSFEVMRYPTQVVYGVQGTIGTNTDERVLLFMRAVDDSVLQLP